MKSGLRSPILAVLLIGATTGAAAQFEEPSHPLSQINPIDIPLNMSDEEVRNVSVLSLSNPSGNGFNLDNYVIADTTGTNRLKLEPAQDQFQIQGSELNLSGNNLTAPNNIKTGGQAVTFRDSTSQQGILRAKEGGSVEIPNGNVVIQEGGSINDTSGTERFRLGSQATILFNQNGRKFIQASTPSPFVNVYEGQDFSIRDNYQGDRAVRYFTDPEIGRLALPGANLDISGNNITSIDTLKFQEGTSIDGSLTINGSTEVTGELNLSGDVDLSNDDLEDVRNITGGGDAVKFEDSIDLNEKTVLNVNALRDNTGTNTLQFDGSNNVEIPDGDLDLGSNSLRMDRVIIGDGASVSDGGLSIGRDSKSPSRHGVAVGTGAYARANDATAVGYNAFAGGGYDSTAIGKTAWAADDATAVGNEANATAQEGTALGNAARAGGGDTAIGTVADATSSGRSIAVGTGANATASNSVAIGGSVKADSANTVRLGGTRSGTPNDVRVPGGNIQLNGNNLVTNREGNMGVETERSLVLGGDTDSDGTGQVAIQTQGNNRVFVTNSGQLEVQDNDLDLQGNRLVDDTSSNTVYIGDGTDDNVRLETGGEDVDVPDGQVDVNSPSNTGRILDVGGGVNADGDLKTFSGNVASDQRMCIGDRCA